MSETPMVERAADALRERIDDWRGGNMSTSDMARLVIQAMRVPPEAVLGAIHDKVRIECRPSERTAYILNADEMWAAGIDAALAAPEEGREP